ncbi:hypothetical protein tb265_25200 [Gemmatimonadetes bacterium T265]|nr:hypothetical protein tb265_25200 [Gemmatimonadetes bacterium T265]
MHQARHVRQRLRVLNPTALPHQGAPWTPRELDASVEKAAGRPKDENHAEVVRRMMTYVGRLADDLHPYPPAGPTPTPASRPHDFAEYQQHYAEADRHLEAILSDAPLRDPRWGPFAPGGAYGAP